MKAGGDGVNGWSSDPGGARLDTQGHLAITIRQCQLSDDGRRVPLLISSPRGPKCQQQLLQKRTAYNIYHY